MWSAPYVDHNVSVSVDRRVDLGTHISMHDKFYLAPQNQWWCARHGNAVGEIIVSPINRRYCGALIFFDVMLNKLLNKLSRCWWIEMSHVANVMSMDATTIGDNEYSLLSWSRSTCRFFKHGRLDNWNITSPWINHYNVIIIVAIASQITSLTVV